MTGHTLIAGVTGSGKSYAEHRLVESVLKTDCELVLLDPKLVELVEYKDDPHVVAYASDIDEIVYTLEDCVEEMETRYSAMLDKGIKQWDGKPRYIFLDETADVMVLRKKEAVHALNRLSMLGRAAKVWLVLCTQRSTADIIPRTIVINLDNIVCLRQAKPRDSYELVGRSGAEKFPRYGIAFLKTPDIPTAGKFRTDDVITKLLEGVA